MAVAADEILTAVVTAIKALSLTGVTSTNIVGMLVGDDEGGDGPNVGGYPCIVCCYATGETVLDATNLKDDIVYPVSVCFVANEKRDQSTNRSRNWGWRQSVRRAFHQQRLAGVTAGNAWKCEVRPGTLADRPQWLQGKHAQVLVIAVFCREGRT